MTLMLYKQYMQRGEKGQLQLISAHLYRDNKASHIAVDENFPLLVDNKLHYSFLRDKAHTQGLKESNNQSGIKRTTVAQTSPF